MIPFNGCRPGNIIFFKGKYFVEVSSCSKTSIGFSDPTNKGAEISCPLGSVDFYGARITEQLLVDKLHWVSYKGPGYSDDKSIKEFTDGRIIVRLNPDNVAIFQPNDFPWAKNIGFSRCLSSE